VVHHTLPKSLEGLYQETGRAGRDGKSSTCVLYFAFKDTSWYKKMIDEGPGSYQQKEQQHANLRQVVAYCMNKIDCRRSQVLQYFGEVFPAENCHHTCDNCTENGPGRGAAGGSTLVPTDVTLLAKAAVELVQDIVKGRNSGTLLHCADVFRGTTKKAIADRGHDRLRHYAAGSKLKGGDCQRLFQRLVLDGYLSEKAVMNGSGFATNYMEVSARSRSWSLAIACSSVATAGPQRQCTAARHRQGRAARRDQGCALSRRSVGASGATQGQGAAAHGRAGVPVRARRV
jgi:superfamily II DNA helicase RecQ